MHSFEDFLNCLEDARWTPAGYIDDSVTKLLAELGGELEILHQEVLSWREQNLEYRGLRSHETATHYKWFVYYHKKLTYRVWLHQFKPISERAFGHAEVPHNHRYSLASLIVAGGFDHHLFCRGGPELREARKPVRSFRAGDTYAVQWNEVHKLDNLRDRTLTIVVESPIVRHYSEAFYEGTGRPRRFYDFAGMHASLCEATELLSSP